MKSYKSKTVNRGTTFILESVEEAIEFGYKGVDRQVGELMKLPNSNYWNPQRKIDQSNSMKTRFDETCEAIRGGWAGPLRDEINQMVEDLHDLVLDIEPTLSKNRAGFVATEEGFLASPELIAAGEEKCLFKAKEGDEPRYGTGDGAYRLLINTDVSWWGRPSDNAALVGALVIVLQQARPVEVWIQQGWLGHTIEDGVSLFKLDFTGCFDPTQLAFWVGHPGKDNPFSYFVNRGLMRECTATSHTAEIPCDIMFRGDWMRLGREGRVGLPDPSKFLSLMYTEKLDFMAAWIAETAMKIEFGGADGDLFPGIK